MKQKVREGKQEVYPELGEQSDRQHRQNQIAGLKSMLQVCDPGHHSVPQFPHL